MATTYKDEKEKLQQEQAQQATNTNLASAVSGTNGSSTTESAAAAKPSYMERLQQLSTQRYTPSDNVAAAQSYLQGIINNKPGSYQSQYTDQLQGLYDQIMNREKFSYDLNGDLLYRQYADQYQRMGNMAMQDTMGQAAAMTGGYGNSYAQTAGQQTFQNYLQQLNNMVPELYQQAYNRYNQEGQNLQQQYAMAQAADEAAYGRHQDAYNEWANERSFAQSAYDTAYQQDYTDYANRLNMAQQALEAEREDAKLAQAYEREDAQRLQETAYNTVMAMIQKGTMPSAELLATAGISEADALELAKKYGYRVPGSSSGGSSKKKSSSGGGTDTKNDTKTSVQDWLWGKIAETVKTTTPKTNSGSIYDQIINQNKINRGL